MLVAFVQVFAGQVFLPQEFVDICLKICWRTSGIWGGFFAFFSGTFGRPIRFRDGQFGAGRHRVLLPNSSVCVATLKWPLEISHIYIYIYILSDLFLYFHMIQALSRHFPTQFLKYSWNLQASWMIICVFATHSRAGWETTLRHLVRYTFHLFHRPFSNKLSSNVLQPPPQMYQLPFHAEFSRNYNYNKRREYFLVVVLSSPPVYFRVTG